MDDMQIQEVLGHYPELNYDPSRSLLFGRIDVGYNDFYEVEVDVSVFPDRFPLVRETEERIPRKADRHIYNTGIFCFTTQAQEDILLKKTIRSLQDFFQNILLPFLQNNSYFEINRAYLQGDYAHGVQGVIEAYQDILGIAPIYKIGEVIIARLRGRKLRPNGLCYCGSGRKIKKCGDHYERYKEFRLVGKDTLVTDAELIIQFLNSTKQPEMLR